MDRRVRGGRVVGKSAAQVVLIGVARAFAATPAVAAEISPGGASAVFQSSSAPAGADVSFPQCGGSLPPPARPSAWSG